MVRLNFAFIEHNKLIIGKKYFFINEYYFVNKKINCCKYLSNGYDRRFIWFDMVSSKNAIQKSMEQRAIIKIGLIISNYISIKLIDRI